MSTNRLQNEYNKAVISSDIFVSLFWTKAGKYTIEEFNESYAHFLQKGKPFIYTYFKKDAIDPTGIKREDINSLLDFKDKLKDLGHFPTDYKNIEDLKNQFGKQLQMILPQIYKS